MLAVDTVRSQFRVLLLIGNTDISTRLLETSGLPVTRPEPGVSALNDLIST
jgi:hypothetical protein